MRAVSSQLHAPAHHAGRYLALAAYLGALVLTYLLVVPPLSREGSVDRARSEAAAIARPDGIPASVPSWAWQMNAWHETRGSERGRRPHGAPNPLPKWYWKWHAWRVQVQR